MATEAYMLDTCCPKCGAKCDAHAPYPGDRGQPGDGDVSVCAQCAEVHVFEGGKLRELTPEERDDILGDETVQHAIAVSREWKR